MNKLVSLIANGEISVKELANAQELIERADLVKRGLDACMKTLVFPLGIKEIRCYSYMDSAGEYEAWGCCTREGIFACYSNWGGDHIIGTCDLTRFSNVFIAFENREFAENLRRFLLEQIRKAN